MIKVLIVEDMEDIRELTSLFLQSRGYGTHIAGNGRQALDVLPIYNPDVILTDIMMPGMDGVAMMKELLVTPWGETPVVVLSALGDRLPPLPLTPAGVLVKPCDLDLLDILLQYAYKSACHAKTLAG